MLKIIHLLNTIRFGGAESVALNYARLMAEQGAKSTLCGRVESTDFERFASKYAAVSPRFSLREIRQADVIFVHSNRQLIRMLLCRSFFRRRGKRIIYMQHLQYSVIKFSLLARLINLICTDFIRISPITENLVNRYIKIPVSFIPNFYLPRHAPHERKTIRERVRKELKIDDYQTLILFSGALKPGKGLDDFLMLAARFSGDKNHRFVVVGDGPEAGKIRDYPHENVLWIGWQADVERFLIAADAYWFLSANEMMPMALIEALTLKVPVWATKADINEYLIDYQEDITKSAAVKLKKLLCKRILHIQVLPKLTGVQRVSLEIFRALADDEFEKTVLFGGPVTVQTAECVRKFRKEGGCNILLSNYLQREIGWHDWRAFWEIHRLCRRGRFDIVHTHSTKPGVIGRIAARLAGVPRVVHTVHGVAFHPYLNHWKRAVYYAIELFASLFSHHIVIVSLYYRNRLAVFKNKLHLIYNGILPYRDEKSADFEEDSTVRILFVGRLEAAKDPLTLLSAFSLIINKMHRKNITLTVVGDGSLEAECRAFAVAEGLSNKVVFTGWQSDVAPFYANHQIFCLSSIHEAFGICLAEAGAQGVASVATRVGGVPEVVLDGVTGLLVPPRDPAAMAAALLKLADDPPLRRRLGAAAAVHVHENFPAARMTARYKELYTRAL